MSNITFIKDLFQKNINGFDEKESRLKSFLGIVNCLKTELDDYLPNLCNEDLSQIENKIEQEIKSLDSARWEYIGFHLEEKD